MPVAFHKIKYFPQYLFVSSLTSLHIVRLSLHICDCFQVVVDDETG